MRWCSISQTRELLSLYCSPWDSCHIWGSRDGGSWLGRSASPRGTWTLWIRALSIPSSWGKVTKKKQAVTGNAVEAPAIAKLESLGSSKDTCLFRSHKPRFAVLIAVNTYASHPQSDRRSASVPSFCHSLSHFRMLPLGGRHQPAGCMHGLFSSEYIHGESSQTWKAPLGGVWLTVWDAMCWNVPKSQLGKLRWCLSEQKFHDKLYVGTCVLYGVCKAFWGKRCYWYKVKPCEYWLCLFH